jgi:hypothetical protein
MPASDEEENPVPYSLALAIAQLRVLSSVAFRRFLPADEPSTPA